MTQHTFDPRSLHVMSGSGATSDKYHPLPQNSETPAAGEVFGCTATEANNVFSNGGEACVIWGARVDSMVAATLTILDGPTESGAGIVDAIQSTTTVEGHSAFPIPCPNGFHINVDAAAYWALSWSPMPARGA